jgi:DNA adenine methylase
MPMPPSERDYQATLFPVKTTGDVVNVAQVPMRSPFRYPGGKTWLVPRIRAWLRSLGVKRKLFIEPFCGGAIVGLTVAFEKLAEKVILVELDEDVSAVWKVILSDDAEYLARRILGFEVSLDNVKKELEKPPSSVREIAFQTVLKNRTYHGGILAPGSGLIKHGENGRGISSRWYPKTLARRIRAISKVRERITFIEGDGLEVIERFSAERRAAFFIDPPYTAAGKKAGRRLYKYHELDHELLFRRASSVRGDVVLTYDNTVEIEELAAKHGFKSKAIAMKNTHHAKQLELIIGRNLEWLV